MSDPAPDPTPDPISERAASPRADRPADARHLIGSFIGMCGMAATLFMVLASGTLAPAWAVVVLTLVWLLLFVLATRWFMTRPWWVAALPVLMTLIWFGSIVVGDLWLGWVA